jgi:uncharacterized protein (TIGR02598 family)
MIIRRKSRAAAAAFTLIEVTLALGVASFCMLSVFGLVPIGLTTNQNAAQQTTAAGIATAISADMHGTPVASGTAATYRFQIPIPAYSATASQMHTLYFSQDGAPAPGSAIDSKPVVTGSNPALYRATVTYTADPNASKVFKVWILVT